MLSVKSRLISAVLAFIHAARNAVTPVSHAFARIPLRRVNRK